MHDPCDDAMPDRPPIPPPLPPNKRQRNQNLNHRPNGDRDRNRDFDNGDDTDRADAIAPGETAKAADSLNTSDAFKHPNFLPVNTWADRVDPGDNIAQQAASGSVAAIVQVLNQRLATRGVRTRAIFDAGWLQLLCESVNRTALDRATLVAQVREILEDIDPAKIRRAQINSRLAREQQLLWLDDIRRQPRQLLWSEAIELRRTHPVQRWWRSRTQASQLQAVKVRAPLSSGSARSSNNLGRGIAIGLGLSLLAVWAYRQWLPSLDRAGSIEATAPAASPASVAPTDATHDPFAAAVMIATQAAIDGQTARSASQWLDLSARWQRAAELMQQLPADDVRHQTATERAALYRNNSAIAQQRAAQASSGAATP